MNEATGTVIDNGDNSIDTTGVSLDNRSQMLATTALFVGQVIAFEAKAGETQKAIGHSVFKAVYQDNANLDALIGDMKIAANWKEIATSEGGKKAKQRLEVAFSGFRLVAERWPSLSEEQRAAILDGTSSVLYVASQMRAADAEEKKAAAAAQKAAEATATATPVEATPVEATPVEATPISLEAQVMALIEAYEAATEQERDEATPAFGLLIERLAVDIDINITETVAAE